MDKIQREAFSYQPEISKGTFNRCENCAYFSDQETKCYLFKILNTNLPELFDLVTEVAGQDSYCKGWVGRQSNDAQQEYLQVLRDTTSTTSKGERYGEGTGGRLRPPGTATFFGSSPVSPMSSDSILKVFRALEWTGRATEIVKGMKNMIGQEPSEVVLRQASALHDLLDVAERDSSVARQVLTDSCEKPPPIQVFTKVLDDGAITVDMFLPVQKRELRKDGKLKVCGWGAVSDVVDNQGDIITAEALAKAAEEWSRWGNIRLMHDPKVIGHADVVEIRKHPITNTDALWFEATISDPTAIRMYQNDELPGFSIGGRVNPGGREEYFIDD